VLSSPIKRAAELVEKAGAGAIVADAAEAGATLSAWSGESRAEFELLRNAAKDWAEHGLAANPHDQFAEAVVQLVTEAGGTRPAVVEVEAVVRTP
jgi:hypothetical protein